MQTEPVKRKPLTSRSNMMLLRWPDGPSRICIEHARKFSDSACAEDVSGLCS
jgi:hypothetical protein